jgi:hypothetical protein
MSAVSAIGVKGLMHGVGEAIARLPCHHSFVSREPSFPHVP